MTRTRFDVAAVVLAVAVAGGLTFALRPQETPAAEPATQAVARPAPEQSAQPSVLFIGDSYTAGSGAQEQSYGCAAAVRLGWLCHLSAVPGTGYISGGPANRFTVDPYIGESTSFNERIPKLALIYRPDVVVLDGGRNDEFPPLLDVFNAMAATIAETHRAWPAATIVFIRPRYLAEPDDDLNFDTEFVDTLVVKSGVENLVVLDPIERLARRNTAPLLGQDEIHPNRQGEQALTKALVGEFLAHGFGKTP